MRTPAPAESAIPFGQSAEGIDRAESLAASTMAHFVTSVALVDLDTTIASTFLVAELLAGLRVHGHVEPEDLIGQFRHLIAQRAAELVGATCPDCGGITAGLAQDMPLGGPETVH